MTQAALGNPLRCDWTRCKARSSGVCEICSTHLCAAHAVPHLNSNGHREREARVKAA